MLVFVYESEKTTRSGSTQAIRKPQPATSFLLFRHQSSVRRCADFTLSTQSLVLDQNIESLDVSPSRVSCHPMHSWGKCVSNLLFSFKKQPVLAWQDDAVSMIWEEIRRVFRFQLGNQIDPSQCHRPQLCYIIRQYLECEKNRSLRHLQEQHVTVSTFTIPLFTKYVFLSYAGLEGKINQTQTFKVHNNEYSRLCCIS